MTPRLLILNGPNLNLLGVREPEIYGATTLAAIEKSCRDFAGMLGIELQFKQSNHEGDIVDWFQAAREEADAIVINPAGHSFHSVPVLDALKMYDEPILETHISNIHARDEHHRHSILSSVSTGVICGLGAYGYIVAMQMAVHMLGAILATIPELVRVGLVRAGQALALCLKFDDGLEDVDFTETGAGLSI